MKAKVVYATMTKHSKKLAEAIARELNLTAENVKDNPVIEDLDLLYIVGGIYGGESGPDMISFVSKLENQVKKAVLVTSCCSKKATQNRVRQILMEQGIEVMNEFICQGSFLILGMGHPNKKDVEDAVEFAKRNWTASN